MVRAINGANASMLCVISGKTQQQEATPKWRSFDLVKWIRARRLQWAGHILRMGQTRKLKQAVFEMFKLRREGDLLMDAPTAKTWRELTTYAADKKYWKARVRAMKQPKVAVAVRGAQFVEGETLSFTVSY